jgi:hypothetical protein
MASGHRINCILVRGSLECKYLQVGSARILRPSANAAGKVAARSSPEATKFIASSISAGVSPEEAKAIREQNGQTFAHATMLAP